MALTAPRGDADFPADALWRKCHARFARPAFAAKWHAGAQRELPRTSAAWCWSEFWIVALRSGPGGKSRRPTRAHKVAPAGSRCGGCLCRNGTRSWAGPRRSFRRSASERHRVVHQSRHRWAVLARPVSLPRPHRGLCWRRRAAKRQRRLHTGGILWARLSHNLGQPQEVGGGVIQRLRRIPDHDASAAGQPAAQILVPARRRRCFEAANVHARTEGLGWGGGRLGLTGEDRACGRRRWPDPGSAG